MKSTSSHASSLNAFPKTIKGRGIAWTPDLQQLLDLRLEKVTERFSPKIRSISASLEDVNGPRGGVDKKCRVVVHLPPRGRVVVAGAGTDIFAAVTGTASRARLAVKRHVKRRRARRRSPGRERRGGRQVASLLVTVW